MATSATTDPDQMDRLSNLSDELLITIFSFLPTHIAARTSVLSRRFGHLWEASPSLKFMSQDLPHPQFDNFVAMGDRVLLRRDPSVPLISLHLDISSGYFHSRGVEAAKCVFSCLSKAGSFGLRHLTIGTLNFGDFSSSCFTSILPVIFSISTLNSLSLGLLPHPSPHGSINSHSPLPCDKVDFPSGTNLTCLRTLSLRLHGTYLAKLNRLLSKLGSLEELHLHVDCKQGLNVSSETIRKLKLIIWARAPKLDAVELFIPSLESLHLELPADMSRIRMDTPLLRKAKVFLDELRAENIRTLVELLNCVPLVEELSLRLEESGLMKFPFPILPEPGKDMLNFPHLKNLNVTACFHKHNIEAVMTMLHHFPALESLNLVHEAAEISSYRARGRKMEDWESKLPRTADSNHPYAHFRNLHLGENRKEFDRIQYEMFKLKEKYNSKQESEVYY